MSIILVVDDDSFIRESLKHALQTHTVYVVNDGLEAIAFLKTITPDLVLTDQNMPNMTGSELAEHLRDKRIAFVMMSSDREALLQISAMDLGAIDYLIKPLSLDQTRFSVDTILKRLPANSNNENDILLNTAIGLLVERFRLSRPSAYRRLRKIARLENTDVVVVARDLVIHVEGLNIGGDG